MRPLPTDLASARALLLEALQHPDALFRCEAIEAVEKSGYAPELSAELLSFLSDADPLTRVCALEALMFNTAPEVITHTLGLAVADPDPLVRGYALTNLAYTNYPWLKAFLWKVYRTDRSHYVKIHALSGLLQHGEAQVYKKLIEYLQARGHLLVINAAQELTLRADRLSPEARAEVVQAMRRCLETQPPVSVAEVLEECIAELQGEKTV